MAIIEVKNLSKTYYTEDVETPVLHDLNFKIEAGEFVAIMGPSGSGKSTLLHILGFLDQPTSGQYFFHGKTMEDYEEEELAHVRNTEMGFVFQAFNLLPRLSVLQNVRLPLIYSDQPEKDWLKMAHSAIADVGMEHRIGFQPTQLSGGEKQRVAIARALVNRPSVIFADEPTGNLDSKSGEKVMEILQRLNREHGHTILLITHETVTAEYARRVIHITDGRIRSDRKVRNNNHSAYKK